MHAIVYLVLTCRDAPIDRNRPIIVKTFEQNEDMYIFLVLPKYHIFSFSTALQKLITCFPGDKLSKIYPNVQIHALALNSCLFLLERQWVFESSIIVAYKSLSCPRCEKTDLKIIQSLLERVQIHTNAGKTKDLWELKDFSEEQQEV